MQNPHTALACRFALGRFLDARRRLCGIFNACCEFYVFLEEKTMRAVLRFLPAALVAVLLAPPVDSQEQAEAVPNRPKVSGKLRLHLREQKETAPGSKEFKVMERTVNWN